MSVNPHRTISHGVPLANTHATTSSIAQTPRSSHTHTIRRVPMQSSLRNQVHQDASPRSDIRQTSRNYNRAITDTARNAPVDPQVVGYSHFPVYSPLPSTQPHALPLHPRSSSAARQASTYIPYRSIASSLEEQTGRDQHGVPSTFAEMQGSLQFSPPFARVYPDSPAGMSDTSLATFENPNVEARPPLTRHEANFEGLKDRLGVQGWKAKAVKIGTSIRRGIALLFDQGGR
ncbi:hypothetical protein EJ07DRAFT_184170 [Lizonia empirigonia]|nr:hypothetical protein EJ07DRAFT_184170 [Lizonia empirigonia]